MVDRDRLSRSLTNAQACTHHPAFLGTSLLALTAVPLAGVASENGPPVLPILTVAALGLAGILGFAAWSCGNGEDDNGIALWKLGDAWHWSISRLESFATIQ
jgi:hypothetical protein